MSKPVLKSSGQQLADAISASEPANATAPSGANSGAPAPSGASQSIATPPGNGGDAALNSASGSVDSDSSPSTLASQSSPSAGPASTPFVSELAELGFADVADEQEGQRRLLESYRQAEEQRARLAEQMRELQPWVQYGRQYYDQMSDPAFQQLMAQRQGPAAPQPAPPAERPWYIAPEYDAETVARYRQASVGADGQVVYDWKPNTPAEVRKQYEAYQQHTELVSDRLVRDPYGAVGEIAASAVLPVVQQMLDRYFAERVDAVRQQEQLQSSAQRLIEQNAEWLYERDPRTNGPMQRYDAATGQPYVSFSPEGQRFYGYLQEANRIGISSPEQRWEYAAMKRQLEQSQPSQPESQQPPPPSAPAPTRDARTADYLKRAAKAQTPAPNRGGASTDSAGNARGGRRGSPGHDLIEEMRRSGIAV